MPRILDEANRCIQCKVPRCRKGCPVNNPIPQFIDMLRTGKINDAGKLIFANNPLSIICSLVCPHENFCEGHCVLGIKGSPVHISAIEQYISDYALDMLDPQPQALYEGKVGVIGGGPAGIALSFYLASFGYDVTIYESSPRIGGVLRFGIPEFRLPKTHIDRLERQLRLLGVKILPNTLIGPVTTISDLFRDGFDALFMSTGVWKPNKMNVPGESLPNVVYATHYLKYPHLYTTGKKVVVIGAGNVAMDAARTAIRDLSSREVTVLYRRDREAMSCRDEEFEYAVMDGVEFKYFTQVESFTEDGVYVYDTREENPESYFLPCDTAIIAVSQGPQANVVSTEARIELDEYGLVKTDEHMMTTLEGVFASGDVVTGAKTVVEAQASAKVCANEIHNYIQAKKQPTWEIEELYPQDILDMEKLEIFPKHTDEVS